MAVRPDEITAILKQQIEQFGSEASSVNVGTVIDAGDGIARVHGLSECMYEILFNLRYSPRLDGVGTDFVNHGNSSIALAR